MKIKLRITIVTHTALTTFAGITQAGTTVLNLNSAYQSESNAANRYNDYASKADAEELKQTAMLFRAAAASEEIHQKIIARAIVQIGGKIEIFRLVLKNPFALLESFWGTDRLHQFCFFHHITQRIINFLA